MHAPGQASRQNGRPGKGVLPLPQRIAALNIAVTGFRGIRHDAEGHQVAGLRILLRHADGVVENRLIINDMVSRQHQHQRVIAILRGLQCRERDSRGGIAAYRLKDDIFRQLIELSQLLGYQKTMLFVADDHGLMDIQPGEARDGFLQHGILSVQPEKLFGIELTGHRPQTATRTTSHNHRK